MPTGSVHMGLSNPDKRTAYWRQCEELPRWLICRRDTMRALPGVGGRKLSETGCSYRMTSFLQAGTFYGAGMMERATLHGSGSGGRKTVCQDVGRGSQADQL